MQNAVDSATKEGVAEDILVLWRIGDAKEGQEKRKATIVAVEQTTKQQIGRPGCNFGGSDWLVFLKTMESQRKTL